jgi:hypothetical protein
MTQCDKKYSEKQTDSKEYFLTEVNPITKRVQGDSGERSRLSCSLPEWARAMRVPAIRVSSAGARMAGTPKQAPGHDISGKVKLNGARY